MIIGDRLPHSAKKKKLSQGDNRKRTGLFLATSPALENGPHRFFQPSNLEKNGPSFEVPMYDFSMTEEPPKLPCSSQSQSSDTWLGQLSQRCRI